MLRVNSVIMIGYLRRVFLDMCIILAVTPPRIHPGYLERQSTSQSTTFGYYTMAEPHKTPTVEDEADDGAAAEENEEDWEDEESEEEEDAEDDDESEGEDEGDEEIDHEDVHELAMKTNALLV